MLAVHILISQVLEDYHIRTTVSQDDPVLGGKCQIMSRSDWRGPLVAPTEDELSTILSVLSEWLNELRLGHPNG